ncbi:hypothetical protein A3K93_02755 [Acinetobacter sp. NCu2D-2]|uniref:ABZJ_00895 family protein n=1 Tax=Acinetobacter sp. NCu2D-2 TaxID=1608473 RepID=UPI0007CDA81C|nr:ABZJ_00895 family protein [Acinetobacter sp. NCu2D-2]ANF81221.1 hypothetical protein A3K93_02755 [Acinetobacter sp. NCu2D-2]
MTYNMIKYFIRFFIYLVLLTMLAGILAGLLPNVVGELLTAFPYLLAMIWVLFFFLKKEQRAPTVQERNRFSLLLVVIFFLYNYIFAVFGPLLFNLNVPNVIELWRQQALNPDFQFLLLSKLLLFMIPFYIITFWFYGPQAKRMANKMFSEN